MRKKCLLSVAGGLVQLGVELLLLISEVFLAAAAFPVLFFLCPWLLRLFWLLRIAGGLLRVALAVSVVGSGGRWRGVLFACSSCSCSVCGASVKRAFWWGSGRDLKLVVIEIGVT